MKKIIIYSILSTFITLLIYSAYKEATKSGISSTRLPCYEGLTVFERIHSSSILKNLKDQNLNLSASLELVPSKFQSAKLFKIVTKEEIESFIETELNAKIDNNLPLHAKVLVMENDTLDPGKKNDKAKLYLGYVRTSFYYEDNLFYQVQIDFLEPEEIASTFKCTKLSLETLL